MKMEKRKFRIGELAVHLAVERFVIRFWEKEFAIRGQRSEGGQRFYDENDLKKFQTIKELLYNQGFTIAGAKKFLKSKKTELHKPHTIIASQVTNMEPEAKRRSVTEHELSSNIADQIAELQRKLLKLRELL